MEAESKAAVAEDPIVACLRAGNPREALALSARLHGASLGRFAMALLGNQAEADEVVQEALLAAYDAMPGYRGESSIRAFLYGIVRHVAAKRLATRVRRERRLVLVRDADAESSLPDEELARWRRARRLRVALEDLRPSEREVLLLRYEAGLSFREVGDATGLDEATARKRTSRALARLRAVIGDEVG